ncbi:GNAT family N-acetyltransferase [Streptomyces sp. BI20]|uniref:GNAT family N-acetyltransferase n=1 Tax=Streptomyces sp. BI20 TaxID=3403460 RepID=UPI003C76DB2A
MGTSVTISAATVEDAEQVFKLRHLAFQSEAARYDNWRIEPLTQSLDSVRAELAAGAVVVARLGEEVVGAVRGSVGEDGTGVIGGLCVHPRLQGHGLGARLLTSMERALAEAVADRAPAARFRLLAGTRADSDLRLYRRAGYVRVGDRVAEDGVEMVVLEKEAGEYVVSA